MENNPFTPLDFLDENQFDINYLESPAFEQTLSQPENFWAIDDLLYTEDFPSWDNQLGGYDEMSLQRGYQPCEPYSSSNFITSDNFTTKLMPITTTESSTSPSPGLQDSPAMSDQQPSSSSRNQSELSPGSEQSAISPPEESPRQSQSASLPGMDWTCRHCARSFTKKHLRTKHEKVHNPTILCPLAPRCQKRTATPRDMRRHVDVRHAEYNAMNPAVSVETFLCGIDGCRYQPKRKDHLKRHVRKVHARMIP